jgi:hypothetical protein
MKTNLIWTTTFLFIFLFKSYSQTLRKQTEKTIFPFRSEVYMKRTIKGFDKPENFFPNTIMFDMTLFDKNFYKNIAKNNDYYKGIHSFERVVSSFKDSTSIYIITEKTVDAEYDDVHYEQWIKSTDFKGKAIDSLQIVFYYTAEGNNQRMLSTIPTKDRIEIEHSRFEWDLEKDDPNDLTKIKVINGYFKIKNGRFIFQNSLKLNVFFDGYGYNDIYSYLNTSCKELVKSTMADYNNDGINDVAYFFKKKDSNDCNKFTGSPLIICLADKHGLLQYPGVDLLVYNNSIIKINELKLINSEINLTIISEKTKTEYSVIGKIIKDNFNVLKITKNAPNSPLIFPNKKNPKVQNIVNFLNDYEKSIK